jgi:hypothetical protein
LTFATRLAAGASRECRIQSSTLEPVSAAALRGGHYKDGL